MKDLGATEVISNSESDSFGDNMTKLFKVRVYLAKLSGRLGHFWIMFYIVHRRTAGPFWVLIVLEERVR